MWTPSLIAQAFAWLALMCLSPFIFAYIRKLASYLAYKLYPRDVLLEYQQNDHLIHALYIRRSLFGVKEIRSIEDKEELDRLRGAK